MKKQLAIITLSIHFFTSPLLARDYKSLDERYAYSLGYELGRDILEQFHDVDNRIMLQAMQDAIDKTQPKLNAQEMSTALEAMSIRHEQQRTALADENSKKGEAFINAYSKKPGIRRLSDGIFFRVIKSGMGTTPRENSTVEVHYKAALINGTEFDSSHDSEQPVALPLNRVIRGLQIAVQHMQPGDKWEIVIPPELAYGIHGTPGGPIGPNETLIFKLELIRVKR